MLFSQDLIFLHSLCMEASVTVSLCMVSMKCGWKPFIARSHFTFQFLPRVFWQEPLGKGHGFVRFFKGSSSGQAFLGSSPVQDAKESSAKLLHFRSGIKTAVIFHRNYAHQRTRQLHLFSLSLLVSHIPFFSPKPVKLGKTALKRPNSRWKLAFWKLCDFS